MFRRAVSNWENHLIKSSFEIKTTELGELIAEITVNHGLATEIVENKAQGSQIP